MRLVPVDTRFFDLLSDLTAPLPKAAGLLHTLFARPAAWDAAAGEIAEIDRHAARVRDDIRELLDESFVTPFDREDIHRVSTGVHQAVRLVDGTARRASAYGVCTPHAPAAALAAVVVRAARGVAAGVARLRRPRTVPPMMREVQELRAELARAHTEATVSLLASPADPLDVLKWQDVYNRLETTGNTLADSARVLESVAIKYA